MDLNGATTAEDAGPVRRHRVLMVRHLAAVMMLGQMNGDTAHAKAVFDALSAIVGDGRSLRVSLALASAFGGDTKPARELMNAGMRDWSQAEPAMVAVALALKIGGDQEWEAIVDQTLAAGIDEKARALAQQVQRLQLPAAVRH